MVKNPVMFTVEVVVTLTTVLFVRDLAMGHGGLGFSFQINLWLWFTVLFANFAEAVAEGRGKAQADALRKTRTDTVAKRLLFEDADDHDSDRDGIEGCRHGTRRSLRRTHASPARNLHALDVAGTRTEADAVEDVKDGFLVVGKAGCG